jgi:hypothetical protein
VIEKNGLNVPEMKIQPAVMFLKRRADIKKRRVNE